MQRINIWHQLHIYRYQVIFTILVSLISADTYAQHSKSINLPNFDQQSIHYGFMLGVHSSRFSLKYNDEFTKLSLDTVHSIIPTQKIGFKVGFLVNFHLFQYLDLRTTAIFSFYQLGLDYRYTNKDVKNEMRDPTYFELPILFKYKSVRRMNRAMYLLVGVTPAIKVSGNTEEKDDASKLLIRNYNLSLDIGVGLDLFQSLFKFSPEVRYSYGLIDALDSKRNDFSAGIESLNIHSFTIFITFEGGPSSRTSKKLKLF